MLPKILSFKKSVLFVLFFLVMIASAIYLEAGDGIEFFSKSDVALSSILEDCDSWKSRIYSLLSPYGGSSSRYIGRVTSGASGLLPSFEHESDSKFDYNTFAPNDPDNSPTSVSPILDFDSSVSTSLFRTRGTLTLQGGSALPYLILNATLWDGDRLVERTRYMVMDVEPGESRDFDICENCRLSPDGEYSCLLEVEEPEGIFASERRDCLVEDVDSIAEIRYEWSASRGIETYSERRSEDSPFTPSSAKTGSSSPSELAASSQDLEDSSADLESEGEGLSSDFSHEDLESEDDGLSSDFSHEDLESEDEGRSSGSSFLDQRETQIKNEAGNYYEDDQAAERRYVGSTTSDKYHLPDCSYAKKIKDENKKYFSDALEAQEAGYSPCKVCVPPQ